MTRAVACWETVLLLPQASPRQPNSSTVNSPLAGRREKYSLFLFSASHWHQMEVPVIRIARSRLVGPQQPGKDAASFLRNSPPQENDSFHQCVSKWFLWVCVYLWIVIELLQFYFIRLHMTAYQLFSSKESSFGWKHCDRFVNQLSNQFRLYLD